MRHVRILRISNLPSRVDLLVEHFVVRLVQVSLDRFLKDLVVCIDQPLPFSFFLGPHLFEFFVSRGAFDRILVLLSESRLAASESK